MDPASLKNTPIWGHLKTVISELLVHRPEKPAELFEAFSKKVESGEFTPLKNPSAEWKYRPRKVLDVAHGLKVANDWSSNYIDLIAPPPPREVNPDDMDADVEREEAVERATIPDFLSDADLFGTVGVGLPNIEVLFLAAALKYVAAKFPVATVRVWGVIRGQPHGYYIVEAAIDPDRIEDNAAADDDDYG